MKENQTYNKKGETLRLIIFVIAYLIFTLISKNIVLRGIDLNLVQGLWIGIPMMGMWVVIYKIFVSKTLGKVNND